MEPKIQGEKFMGSIMSVNIGRTLFLPAIAAGVLTATSCHKHRKDLEGGAGGGTPDPTISEITLLAGGLGGPGSMDDTGPLARFSAPSGIATDGANLYVADFFNYTIRKIEISTGETTTLAGLPGRAGFTDGIGSAARFGGPRGIATDGTNLYVADTFNQIIRKIVLSTGEVSTLAGRAQAPGTTNGTGAGARFRNPWGIATDGTNVYVTEQGSHTIRKIVISTKAVTTLAGLAGQSGSADGIGSTARFNSPLGAATDATYVYIADTNNHTIRQVEIATGSVTTLAGAAGQSGASDGSFGEARFSQPLGIATDGARIYVGDFGNTALRQLEISMRAVSTLAGSPGQPGSTDGTRIEARFRALFALATDGTNLFAADGGFNGTVRKAVLSTGVVTTLAGLAGQPGSADGTGGTARFSDPSGLATDGINLYVADKMNHTVRQISRAAGTVTTLAGLAGEPGSADGIGAGARFNQPTGLATDGIYVYVTDLGNSTIRRVVISTGEVQTLAGVAGQVGSENGIGGSARFSGPSGIATDGRTLYITDQNNQTIRQFAIATWVVTTLAGLAGQTGSEDGIGSAARFYLPDGIATDGTNLYVADVANNTIRQIVIATGAVTTLAGQADMAGWSTTITAVNGIGTAARFNHPFGLALDGTDLYISETRSHTIRKLDLLTAEVTTPIGVQGYGRVDLGPLPGTINSPAGLCAAEGWLFISSQWENSVLIAPMPN